MSYSVRVRLHWPINHGLHINTLTSFVESSSPTYSEMIYHRKQGGVAKGDYRSQDGDRFMASFDFNENVITKKN